MVQSRSETWFVCKFFGIFQSKVDSDSGKFNNMKDETFCYRSKSFDFFGNFQENTGINVANFNNAAEDAFKKS